MPPRHPRIAHALGLVRRRLGVLRAADGPDPVRVHVACSGGPDSVALLGVLSLLAPRDRLRLSVGHVDHGLRAASAEEAALVRSLARAQQLPYEVTQLELAVGAGLPARARQARRAALRSQADRAGARFIALGHTATDQAETILLHLTRGAGLTGLSAMAEYDPWPDETPGGILRPLLDLPRAEVRQLAQLLELPFVDDPTNEDLAHPRVRVRRQVLPVLARHNPQVEHALARAAAHAREAEEALQAWVEQQLRVRRRPITDRSTVTESGSTHIVPARDGARPVTPAASWSTEGMDQIPRAVRTRFVRRLCREAGCPDDGLSAQTLASIDVALAEPGPRRAWDLHPWLRLRIEDGQLWVEDVQVATRAGNH